MPKERPTCEHKYPKSIQRKVTIQEIANLAGVSIGTVHRALYGKKGVSEALRQQILQIARERHYVPHGFSSSAERKRVLILAPGPYTQNRYYYGTIWKGFQDYIDKLEHQNVSIVDLPYYRSSGNSMLNELYTAFERYEDEIDGLLVAGPFTMKERKAIQTFSQKGVPIVLATETVPGVLASVSVDFYQAGCLAAEILSSQLVAGSSILLCAGDLAVITHSFIVQGFTDYLYEHGDLLNCIYVYSKQDSDARSIAVHERQIEEILERNQNIKAVFCVNARESVLMSKILKSQSLVGKLRFVGSDLFTENVEAMREGVMQNILFKSPYRQAYTAAKILFDYLLEGIKPAQSEILLGSDLIFQSNLSAYWLEE